MKKRIVLNKRRSISYSTTDWFLNNIISYYKIRVHLIFSFMVLPLTFTGQTINIDSLITNLETKQHDTLKVITLNKIGQQFGSKGDYVKALEYATKAKILATKIQYKKGLANSCLMIGNIYSYQNNYDKTLSSLFSALNIYKEIGYQEGIGSAYNNISIIYNHRGDYKKAIDYSLKALKIKEEAGNKKGIANIFNNIGDVYYNMGNYKKALEYYLNSLKIRKENNFTNSIPLSYINIGNIYKQQGTLKKAFENYTEALEISKEVDDKLGMTNSYFALGEIFYLEGNYKEGLNANLKALEICNKFGDNQLVIQIYNSIGKIYLKLRDFNKSATFLILALNLGKEKGDKISMKESYLCLSDLYAQKHEYKLAYDYQKLFYTLNDSLLSEKITEQMAEMEVKYESKKKDNEIKVLNKENELRINQIESKNKEQKITVLSSVILTVLIILLTVYIYRSYRQKQKVRIEQIEKEKIKAELNLLKNQISPHVMFNSLNTIFYQIDEQADDAKEMVLLFADLLRYQLYECNVELIAIEKEIDYLKKFIKIQSLRKSDRCQIGFNISETVKDFIIAPLLLIPLVENAFKYVSNDKYKDNFILINLEREGNKVVFTIKNTTHEEINESKKAFGGIGLSNLKGRLELIYLNKHELYFFKEDNIFNAKLVMYV